MKKERKFIWCVRFYDIVSDIVRYSVYVGLTVREIRVV